MTVAESPMVTKSDLAEIFAELRREHPAAIPIGGCLCCGHHQHVGLCARRDFWVGMCDCGYRGVRKEPHPRRKRSLKFGRKVRK